MEPMPPTRSAYPTNFVLIVPWTVPGIPKESKKRGYPTEPMPHTKYAYPTNSVLSSSLDNPRNSHEIKKTLPHGTIPHTRSAYPANYVSVAPRTYPRNSQGIKETRLPHGTQATYQICLSNKLCSL